MQQDPIKRCRGCGAALNAMSKSLEMPGYCAKCANQSQDDIGLSDLPSDVTVADIMEAGLSGDLKRFTLIAVLAGCSCFGGAIVGAMMAGPNDPTGRSAASLQASWLFVIVALFVGKIAFLRTASVITLARWKMFWGYFVIFYFITYIPLGIYLVRRKDLPLPPDLATFLTACVVAYVAGVFFVVTKDIDLKKWLCGRCVLPSSVIEAARGNDWSPAEQLISEIVTRSQGLVTAGSLQARMYLARGEESLAAGDIDQASDYFRKGADSHDVAEALRLRIGCALSEAGCYSEACNLLDELASKCRDKDVAGRSRKVVKEIRKRHRLNIKCTKCGAFLLGTTDMIGDMAVCTRCKTEFVISGEPAER